jgi:hypothetical protein
MIEEPAIPEARTTIRGCVEDEEVQQSSPWISCAISCIQQEI